MNRWLQNHKFGIYLITFILMILASIGLYFNNNTEPAGLIWGLLGVFISVNLIIIFVK